MYNTYGAIVMNGVYANVLFTESFDGNVVNNTAPVLRYIDLSTFYNSTTLTGSATGLIAQYIGYLAQSMFSTVSTADKALTFTLANTADTIATVASNFVGGNAYTVFLFDDIGSATNVTGVLALDHPYTVNNSMATTGMMNMTTGFSNMTTGMMANMTTGMMVNMTTGMMNTSSAGNMTTGMMVNMTTGMMVNMTTGMMNTSAAATTGMMVNMTTGMMNSTSMVNVTSGMMMNVTSGMMMNVTSGMMMNITSGRFTSGFNNATTAAATSAMMTTAQASGASIVSAVIALLAVALALAL